MDSGEGSGVSTLRVAFVHPDLGLGGAERLIVDAASELAGKGHQVDVYTAYYDPGRCFEETRSGAFTVTVAGAWFPRNILGRANALCAYLRCILVALHIAWLSRKPGSGYDVIIADQVSAVVPVLKALTSARVLFYCHFPDMLLSKPSSALHALYRLPLDWVEQTTTGMADRVLVNSDYTRGIFEETFARLSRRRVVPDVLYPAVVLPSDAQLAQTQAAWRGVLPAHVVELIDCGPVFVSINRFERKKGIAMAVEALHQLSSQAAANTEARQPGLIIAGGFDSRLPENVEHLRELGQLAMRLGVRERVAFLPSFADAVRPALLAAAVAVLYTPMGEHFGIVPLEAMAAGTPVVACNSGGPMESVVNGQTGFLCSPTPEDFAGAMAKLLDPAVAAEMGQQARRRVQERFSRASFGQQLNTIVNDLAERKAK